MLLSLCSSSIIQHGYVHSTLHLFTKDVPQSYVWRHSLHRMKMVLVSLETYVQFQGLQVDKVIKFGYGIPCRSLGLRHDCRTESLVKPVSLPQMASLQPWQGPKLGRSGWVTSEGSPQLLTQAHPSLLRLTRDSPSLRELRAATLTRQNRNGNVNWTSPELYSAQRGGG